MKAEHQSVMEMASLVPQFLLSSGLFSPGKVLQAVLLSTAPNRLKLQ